MIVNISKQFQGLAGKIYTFSIIALSLKFLPIEAISQFGLKITLVNDGVVSGALGALTLLLTVASIPCLIRDYLVTRISDSLDLNVQDKIGRDDLLEAGKQGDTVFDKRTKWYFSFSWVVFFVEGITPIVLGLAVSWMTRVDMLCFIQEVTK